MDTVFMPDSPKQQVLKIYPNAYCAWVGEQFRYAIYGVPGHPTGESAPAAWRAARAELDRELYQRSQSES